MAAKPPLLIAHCRQLLTLRPRNLTMRRNAACLLALLSLCLPGCRPARQEAEVIEWMRQNAIPLATVEAGHGFDDMQPLKAVIGDARIVALGESTHGTREIYQLKHRMLEFLANEMGFTLFGFESPWPEGLALNDYVLHGKGDPVELLRRAVFGVFYSQEVFDTIEWMRQYNERVPPEGRVQFCGIDLRGTRTAARVVTDYLRKVDPDYAARLEPTLQLLRKKEIEPIYSGWPPRGEPPDPEEMAKVDKDVPGLFHRFFLKQAEYIARSSEPEWRLARHHARIMFQTAEVYRKNAWPLRDLYMAANVEWILNQEPPGSKMVLSAHNGHVSFGEFQTGAAMGHHLKKKFGSGVVVFGFAFHQGAFRGTDFRKKAKRRGALTTFTVEPAPDDSLDAVLAKVGFPIFVLDLRKAPQPVAEWFQQERRTREVGGGIVEGQSMFRKLPVGDHYDALIFIDTTTALRPGPPRR
ncbi:MAG: erythromycin esterase family protein [Terriglobia bacterium]